MKRMVYMKRFVNKGILIAVSVLIGTTPLYAGTAANSYLGSWTAELISEPVYDSATNLTRYSYSLSGTTYVAGDPRTGKNLSHWVIPLQDGMVVDHVEVDQISSPTWSVGQDPTTGVYGLKYDDGQPLDTTYTYTFYLTGQWGAEDGSFFVKAGSNRVSESVEEGSVQVPGAGGSVAESYSITGKVFVDINDNGVWDTFEPRLANVPIALNGNLATLTDANGGYIISGLTAGNYQVSVDGAGGGFAASLTAYFDASGVTTHDVDLTGDIDGVDFSYTIDLDAIVADLDPEDLDGNGIVLAGEGRTIGFWKHQLKTLITGKGKAQLSQDVIDGLINQVNQFFIADPFVLTGYDVAFNTLANQTSDAHQLLLKQLLAGEFNLFNGMGLADSALYSVILESAESYAYAHDTISRTQLLAVKDLLDAINNMGH